VANQQYPVIKHTEDMETKTYEEIYHNMRNAMFEKVYSINLVILGVHASELNNTA